MAQKNQEIAKQHQLIERNIKQKKPFKDKKKKKNKNNLKIKVFFINCYINNNKE